MNTTLYVGTWLTHGWDKSTSGAPKQKSPLHDVFVLRKSISHIKNNLFFTSADVKKINLGKPDSPFSLISGQYLYLAKFMAYILDTEPPAKTKTEICIAWRPCSPSAGYGRRHGWLRVHQPNDKLLSKSREHPPPIPLLLHTSSSPVPEVLVYSLIPELF